MAFTTLQKEVVVLTSVCGYLSCIAFYYRSIVQWGCVRDFYEISYYLKGHHCNSKLEIKKWVVPYTSVATKQPPKRYVHGISVRIAFLYLKL